MSQYLRDYLCYHVNLEHDRVSCEVVEEVGQLLIFAAEDDVVDVDNDHNDDGNHDDYKIIWV